MPILNPQVPDDAHHILDLNALALAYFAAPADTQDADDAHNAFCEAASDLMDDAQRDQWDAWCLKATSAEILVEAFRVLGVRWTAPDEVDAAAELDHGGRCPS